MRTITLWNFVSLPFFVLAVCYAGDRLWDPSALQALACIRRRGIVYLSKIARVSEMRFRAGTFG